VDTVGKNTEAIKQYIENQLREDMLNDQLTLEEASPFTGRK
jgi:putative transposase